MAPEVSIACVPCHRYCKLIQVLFCASHSGFNNGMSTKLYKARLRDCDGSPILQPQTWRADTELPARRIPDRGDNVPSLAGDFEDWLTPVGPSIVYEDIDSAKVSYSGLHCCPSGDIGACGSLHHTDESHQQLHACVTCNAASCTTPTTLPLQSRAPPRGPSRSAPVKSHLPRRSGPANPALLQRKTTRWRRIVSA